MICISFDTDHMDEHRMVEFLSKVYFPGLGTFFCTQSYHCLSTTIHEIAPHPYLGADNDWDQELINKRQEFPKAIGWRSHSCVFSHKLAFWLWKNNYKYVTVHDDFGRCAMQPIKHSWGVWHLPIYYMDNLDFCRQDFFERDEKPFSRSLIDNALEQDGIYVFDFHPIHLLLNTPSSEFYFEKRQQFCEGISIEKLSYTGYGTLNFFKDLCAAMQNVNIKSLTLEQALAFYHQNMEKVLI